MAEDEHSKSGHSHKKAKRKKIIKLIVFFAVVIKLILVAIFVVLVVRAESPKLRLRRIRVQSLVTGSPEKPTFDVSYGAELTIKNPNFGRYLYDETTVSFVYQGIVVGQAEVPEGKVWVKSTEEVPITATASSTRLAGLAGNVVAEEIRAGILSLSGKAVMSGEVEFLRIVKKKKDAELDCLILLSLATKMVQLLECN